MTARYTKDFITDTFTSSNTIPQDIETHIITLLVNHIDKLKFKADTAFAPYISLRLGHNIDINFFENTILIYRLNKECDRWNICPSILKSILTIYGDTLDVEIL